MDKKEKINEKEKIKEEKLTHDHNKSSKPYNQTSLIEQSDTSIVNYESDPDIDDFYSLQYYQYGKERMFDINGDEI